MQRRAVARARLPPDARRTCPRALLAKTRHTSSWFGEDVDAEVARRLDHLGQLTRTVPAQNATSGGSSDTRGERADGQADRHAVVMRGDHRDAGREVAEHLAVVGRVDDDVADDAAHGACGRHLDRSSGRAGESTEPLSRRRAEMRHALAGGDHLGTPRRAAADAARRHEASRPCRRRGRGRGGTAPARLAPPCAATSTAYSTVQWPQCGFADELGGRVLRVVDQQVDAVAQLEHVVGDLDRAAPGCWWSLM